MNVVIPVTICVSKLVFVARASQGGSWFPAWPLRMIESSRYSSRGRASSDCDEKGPGISILLISVKASMRIQLLYMAMSP
jgi:hypothetical protein